MAELARLLPIVALAHAMAHALVLALTVAAVSAGSAERHGIAMHGTPALAEGFPHFPYVRPDAPKGGRLTLGALGAFDSLNPFIIKGVTPDGLRGYVFESLLARSADEPFSLYGHIAEAIGVPADRSSITFHLRPQARFSDGMPITPHDVLFSHAILRDKGFPYHRSYYAKVTRAEQTGPHTVRFEFDATGDREMALIMGLMPILPRHRYSEQSFEQTTLEPPVGSGPYTVEKVDAGRTLVYRRDPDWWARGLPTARGRFNFDEIRYEFFRDGQALFEAFKAGAIDLRAEDDPTRWAEGYDFPAARDGRISRHTFKTGLPAGMSALAMNARRKPFDDQRVRQAMILLFDFEWLNRSLFHGLYKRTDSFFSRSELSSAGAPASERELSLLGPHRGEVKPQILDGTWRLPESDASGSNRENMRRALDLLSAAGFRLDGRRLVDGEGRQLGLELLAANRNQERLMLAYARMLERLGIAPTIRLIDSAQYWSRIKTFDFDVIHWSWGASLSPGNEQINRWSSRAAGIEGSLNYPGVRSAAADRMIEALLAASDREDFVAAVRAFDRVLLSGDHVIPLFHLPAQWVAHWTHLERPATTPLFGYDVDTWWRRTAP